MLASIQVHLSYSSRVCLPGRAVPILLESFPTLSGRRLSGRTLPLHCRGPLIAFSGIAQGGGGGGILSTCVSRVLFGCLQQSVLETRGKQDGRHCVPIFLQSFGGLVDASYELLPGLLAGVPESQHSRFITRREDDLLVADSR
jgi:hypothetical protein